MHQSVSDDRLWFQGNPVAIVRFGMHSLGNLLRWFRWEKPPFFDLAFAGLGPLRWVAVVDLMRLAGSSFANPEKASARLRLQIPAIPVLEGRRRRRSY